MKRQTLLIYLLLWLFNVMAYGQDSIKVIKLSDMGEPHDFSFQNKWDYFILEDTIIVKVIEHIPAPAACGIIMFASLTIVLTENGDSIRVIDMCNTSDKYIKGLIIKVAPSDKPTIELTTPFTLTENPTIKKFEPSTYDLTVFKTTWGKLSDK